MLGRDFLRRVQIRDGSGNFEDAIVSAGREAQAAHGHLQDPFARLVQRTQLSELLHGNVGVVGSACLLDRPRLDHPLPDLGGAGAVILPPQFLKGQRRYLNVQIDAVEQRPANLPEIALNDAARASALAVGTKVSTRAPV